MIYDVGYNRRIYVGCCPDNTNKVFYLDLCTGKSGFVAQFTSKNNLAVSIVGSINEGNLVAANAMYDAILDGDIPHSSIIAHHVPRGWRKKPIEFLLKSLKLLADRGKPVNPGV